ncbi:hypothetical protein F444_00056 [Phytophthora nicotianae P1976]|uniref:Uncharacterized protein n=1 Tax=Phytophthora nicotianae P1976 TaxID=1317066 RepID=A0A081B5J8_PHYNI|nr:hypothetical protein F444_00056 [Phytophthora nicotianae P1976]
MDLQLAFVLDGQAEWRGVPEVVRSSFLLMAQELRRLHSLLLAGQQDPTSLCQKDPRIEEMQTQLSKLKAQLQDQQAQAETNNLRTKKKLSSLWGEVAATAKAAADAQAQQTVITDSIQANWAAAEFQLEILTTKMEDQNCRLKRSRMQVDQALHELQMGQQLCRQDLRRLHRVVSTHVAETTQDHEKVEVEVRGPEEVQLQKQDGEVHVLLHQRCVEALKRQQQRERNDLRTV